MAGGGAAAGGRGAAAGPRRPGGVHDAVLAPSDAPQLGPADWRDGIVDTPSDDVCRRIATPTARNLTDVDPQTPVLDRATATVDVSDVLLIAQAHV